MPWKTIKDAVEAMPNLEKLDDVKLTLSQINAIAAIAEAIDEDEVENVWAVAIGQWKEGHEIKEDRWVEKEKKSESAAHPHGEHKCECPECGYTVMVAEGIKCNAQECSECGEQMRAVEIGEQRNSENSKNAAGFQLDASKYSLAQAREIAAASNIGAAYPVVRDGIIHFVSAPTQGKPAADNPPDPKLDDLYAVEGVEIFRAGKWTDSSGIETEYKKEDLEKLIKVSRSDGIPLKLGHWADQAERAVGWVENLRMKGKSLLADLVKIPVDVYKEMKQSGFRKRSAEIIRNGSTPELIGVALLGAAQSALPLKDIFSQHENGVVYCYSVDSGNIISEIQKHTDGGETSMDEKQKLEAENKRLQAKVSEYEAAEKKQAAEYVKGLETVKTQHDELATKVDALEKDVADKDVKIAEYVAADEKRAKAADEADVERFGKLIATRIQPAIAEDVKGQYAAAEGDVRKSLFEKYEKMSIAPELKEHGTDGGGLAPGTGEDKIVKEDEEMAKYAKENGLDLSDAADYAKAATATLKYTRPLPLDVEEKE